MRFGCLTAIDNLSLAGRKGEITSLIGHNGVFNCLTGFYKPTAGQTSSSATRPQGRALPSNGWRASASPRWPISLTFQSIRLFPRMTVLENLIVAQDNVLMRALTFAIANLLRLARYRNAEKTTMIKILHWLEKVNLVERADLGRRATYFTAWRSPWRCASTWCCSASTSPPRGPQPVSSPSSSTPSSSRSATSKGIGILLIEALKGVDLDI